MEGSEGLQGGRVGVDELKASEGCRVGESGLMRGRVSEGLVKGWFKIGE